MIAGREGINKPVWVKWIGFGYSATASEGMAFHLIIDILVCFSVCKLTQFIPLSFDICNGCFN